MPTISGDVGGTGASGANVLIRSSNGAEVYRVNADANGLFTVTVNGYAKYNVSAQLANKVYRNSADVQVVQDNVSAVNLSYNALNDPSNYT